VATLKGDVSMPTSLRLALLACVLHGADVYLSTGVAQDVERRSDKTSAAGELFESPDQAFRVWFPATPQAGENEKFRYYQAGKDGLHYLVNTYSDELVGEESYELQHIGFDASRDGIKKRMKGKLVEDVNIRLANRYEGRMLRLVCPDQDQPSGYAIYRIRIYYIGDHVYQLWAGGPPDVIDGEAANRFLDSFSAAR
jgi:hypothetical protein